jgi:DNA-binding NarL/FixJ family response regulator
VNIVRDPVTVIAVFSPNRLTWNSIGTALEGIPAARVLPVASNRAKLLALLSAATIDVIVLAVEHAGTTLLALVAELCTAYPAAMVLLIAEDPELPELGAALGLGVRGCLLASELSAASLAADMQCLLSGNRIVVSALLWQRWQDRRRAVRKTAPSATPEGPAPQQLRTLSEREQGILKGLNHGLSGRQIERDLNLSSSSVRRAMLRLHERFGTTTSNELRSYIGGHYPAIPEARSLP